MIRLTSVIFIFSLFLLGCEIRYSFTGGQFSGAKTFSVQYIKPQTALASPAYAQRLTESFKDIMLSQSPLSLTENNGDLQYSGSITQYSITPVAVQSNETASLTRLSITIKINYNNTLEPELNFEKSFTKFADFPAGQSLFSVEEELWQQINDQLTQEIYNSSVGNW
jgi:Lipopolysaccharide-assembly